MSTTAEAGPASSARGRATRERIVAAAAGLMHEHGVRGTSLDDVRAATGTSKSQLYHYFADKSALVRAVVARQVESVLGAQQPELGDLDSLVALRRWRDRVVALNAELGPAGGCPLGRLTSELSDRDPDARSDLGLGFGRWRAHLSTGLRTMVDRGDLAADCDPEQLALGLLAAAEGGLLLAQNARSSAPLEAALDLALDGIAARRCPPAATPP